MFGNFDFSYVLLAIPPVMLSLVMREIARGYVAYRCGDPTALQFGRLTLNPMAHIDLIGTIIVPALSLALTPFVYGWVRPIPINARNFKNVRSARRWIALAGPVTNLLLVYFWGMLSFLIGVVPEAYTDPLTIMVDFGMTINIVLIVINLLPILPLDGGVIVDSFLNAKWSMKFRQIEPYGTWIVLALLLTGALSGLINLFSLMIGSSVSIFTALILAGIADLVK